VDRAQRFVIFCIPIIPIMPVLAVLLLPDSPYDSFDEAITVGNCDQLTSAKLGLEFARYQVGEQWVFILPTGGRGQYICEHWH